MSKINKETKQECLEGIKYYSQLGDQCIAYEGFLVVKGNAYKRIICINNVMPFFSNAIQDVLSILCNMLMTETTLQFMQLEGDCCDKFFSENYSSDQTTTSIKRLLGISKNTISCHLMIDLKDDDEMTTIQQGMELSKLSQFITKLVRNCNYADEITFESIQQMVDKIHKEYPDCLQY